MRTLILNGSPRINGDTAAILLYQLNATVIGEAISLQTNNLPASEDISALKAARELGRKLGTE